MRRFTTAPLIGVVLIAGCAPTPEASASPGGSDAASPPARSVPSGDTVRLTTGLLSHPHPRPHPDVRVYPGIPFASPPVGALRWRPPEPPAAWEGVRSAAEFGPGCMQELAGSRLPWTEEFMHQGDVSEDCLYLNVWTAAESEAESRPVLVYIHGGGFGEGSGSVAVYDGASLAAKGLVVVTVNYRLGALGFLAHPALTAESSHAASGNYGLLDQVAALAWVRDNIAAFGGDPGNVTIAGQSAGAMSVYVLTASPLAAGLLHGAIVQSGPGGLASFGVRDASVASTLAQAESVGTAFGAARGAESTEELRALTVAELSPRAGAGGPPARFGPVVDGWLLPDDVPAIYAAGEQNEEPVLMGFNADEGSAFPGYGDSTPDAMRRMGEQRFGDADRFLELYPPDEDEDGDGGNQAKAALRDLAAVALTRLAAERAEAAETPAWLYYFERGIPWPEHPEYGAFHTGEVPYVFASLDRLERPWEPMDRDLADVMSSYWVAFAMAGDPNGPALPEWPAFDGAPRTFMVLGESIGPEPLPGDPARRAFLEAVLERP